MRESFSPDDSEPSANEFSPLPKYLTIASQVEAAILDGTVPDDALAPSARILSKLHGVNIATATRALRTLQDRGVVRRLPGIGMYILADSRDRLRAVRREDFVANHIVPCANEARRLGLGRTEVVALLTKALSERDV